MRFSSWIIVFVFLLKHIDGLPLVGNLEEDYVPESQVTVVTTITCEESAKWCFKIGFWQHNVFLEDDFLGGTKYVCSTESSAVISTDIKPEFGILDDNINMYAIIETTCNVGQHNNFYRSEMETLHQSSSTKSITFNVNEMMQKTEKRLFKMKSQHKRISSDDDEIDKN